MRDRKRHFAGRALLLLAITGLLVALLNGKSNRSDRTPRRESPNTPPVIQGRPSAEKGRTQLGPSELCSLILVSESGKPLAGETISLRTINGDLVTATMSDRDGRCPFPAHLDNEHLEADLEQGSAWCLAHRGALLLRDGELLVARRKSATVYLACQGELSDFAGSTCELDINGRYYLVQLTSPRTFVTRAARGEALVVRVGLAAPEDAKVHIVPAQGDLFIPLALNSLRLARVRLPTGAIEATVWPHGLIPHRLRTGHPLAVSNGLARIRVPSSWGTASREVTVRSMGQFARVRLPRDREGVGIIEPQWLPAASLMVNFPVGLKLAAAHLRIECSGSRSLVDAVPGVRSYGRVIPAWLDQRGGAWRGEHEVSEGAVAWRDLPPDALASILLEFSDGRIGLAETELTESETRIRIAHVAPRLVIEVAGDGRREVVAMIEDGNTSWTRSVRGRIELHGGGGRGPFRIDLSGAGGSRRIGWAGTSDDHAVVELVPHPMVYGVRTVDAHGRPVAGVAVRFYDAWDARMYVWRRTGADGRVVLRGPVGAGNVEAGIGDPVWDGRVVSIPRGEFVDQVVWRKHVIEVHNQSTNPLLVRAIAKPGQHRLLPTVVPPKESATLRGLPPGTYDVNLEIERNGEWTEAHRTSVILRDGRSERIPLR